MSDVIVNKVAESGIVTLNLEEYYPKSEAVTFDLKDYLFMGLILKEKDFRAALTTTDWSKYQNKLVAVTCTADAIIPVWAYMLVASNLQAVAAGVFLGTTEQMIENIILQQIEKLDISAYEEKRIVVKGCGEIPIPPSAYLAITAKLKPVVKSIMYGEPCSTVPVYKKR